MYIYYQRYHCLFNLNIADTHIFMTCISSVPLVSKEWKTTNQKYRNTNQNRSGHLPCASHRIKLTKTEQEMCASQHTPVYINRVFPLPLGNRVAKFGKDPIHRTTVIVQKRPCCQQLYF